MRNIVRTLLVLVAFVQLASGQENKDVRIPLIGEPAPEFMAPSTQGNINFPRDYFGKWKVLFSHPGDFTPVCTSEMIAFASKAEEFSRINTVLVGISTDGINSHLEWVKSMESLNLDGNGAVKIKFPIISDPTLQVSRRYGMLHPNYSATKDIRGVFIIDPENKIRATLFYPLTTGRNIDEIYRTVVALQLSDKENILTPANWQPGKDVLIHSPATHEDADKLAKIKDPDLYSPAWYLWFKKMARK